VTNNWVDANSYKRHELVVKWKYWKRS